VNLLRSMVVLLFLRCYECIKKDDRIDRVWYKAITTDFGFPWWKKEFVLMTMLFGMTSWHQVAEKGERNGNRPSLCFWEHKRTSFSSVLCCVVWYVGTTTYQS
jgi:hypothetical protein